MNVTLLCRNENVGIGVTCCQDPRAYVIRALAGVYRAATGSAKMKKIISGYCLDSSMKCRNSNHDGSVNTNSSPVFLIEGDFVLTTFLYADGGGFCASVLGSSFPTEPS